MTNGEQALIGCSMSRLDMLAALFLGPRHARRHIGRNPGWKPLARSRSAKPLRLCRQHDINPWLVVSAQLSLRDGKAVPPGLYCMKSAQWSKSFRHDPAPVKGPKQYCNPRCWMLIGSC